MKVCYFKKDARNVTSFYYQIIIDAIQSKGVDVVSMDGEVTMGIACRFNKEDYALITDVRDFFKLYLFGHRRFIYWYQGVMPEEILMMTGAKYKYYLFSFLEKLSLKSISFKIGVSSYLFKHYEEKYKIRIKQKSIFVMPCFNNDLNKDSFFGAGKYDDNTFCYAGSTEVWQGFDQMVELYGEIEKKYNNVSFKVFSKDLEGARAVLSRYKIKNYSLKSLLPEEVDAALSACKFGFIIREENKINNVATPTKMGTYIGNGVIPVFTPAVRTFADWAENYKYLCCANVDKLADLVGMYINQEVKATDVYGEYQHIFATYYNRGEYVKSLAMFLDL